MNWAFSISSQVRALIGPENEPVSETGMRWFRNGKYQGKNADHRVASTYQLHGTLNPVSVGETVNYQDSINFTTTDGRAGTLVIAGTLILKP